MAKHGEEQEAKGKRLQDCSPLTQIFVYSCAMQSRYCVLTTGQYTWFIQRRDADLDISRGFQPSDTNPSLAQAWVTFVNLAVTNREKVPSPEHAKQFVTMLVGKRDKSAKQGAATRARNKAKKQASSCGGSSTCDGGASDSTQLPLESISCDFSPTESYGPLNHGVAYRNRIHGFDSVIKIVDASKDSDGEAGLEREADMYEELSDLWGKTIPSMVFSGPISLGRYSLATTYEGKSLDDPLLDVRMGRNELKRKACDALKTLHQHGMLHGDVALRNVVVDPATKSVKLIDLGSATEVGSDKNKMATEMRTLSELVDKRLGEKEHDDKLEEKSKFGFMIT
jgi:hypothetical protein